MVFYRKYRPKTLSELDNRVVAQLLGRYLAGSEVPHAFLFIGPKGTGKTSTARIIAKNINCPKAQKDPERKACGICDVCERIAKGDALDVMEIDAASNRGIEEIRDLREKIKLSPTELVYKVYIIDEVHMLTTEAFNALLKTLEEPPKHAIFILATTEEHKIPQTIISRCVLVEFQKATEEDIVHSLSRIVKGEKLDAEKEALLEIAKISDGSFRDAHKLFEEVALEKGKITAEKVRKSMHVSSTAVVSDFIELLRKKQTKELLQIMQKIEKEGKNVQQFFIDVLKNLQTVLIDSISNKSDWERKELLRVLECISDAFPKVKNAIIPSLPLEMAVIAYCEDVGKEEQKETDVVETTAKVLITATSPDGNWEKLLEILKPLNHSIVGVLRSCKSLGVTDNVLTIEAAFKFHAEKLDDPKVRELVMKAVSQIYGKDIHLRVVLKKRS